MLCECLGTEVRMNRILQKKAGAYFTVEATLVLTLTLGVIVVLIYIMFFQYNRCLLEQDIGALALKGCAIQAESKEELLQKLRKYESQIYLDKYIAWECGEVSIELKQDEVKVERAGCVIFPFSGEAFFDLESRWETKAVYENECISPVAFVRAFNKLKGGN